MNVRAEVKIAETDAGGHFAVLAVFHAEDVLGLEVPVGDALGVQVLEGFGQLADDCGSMLLAEANLVVDLFEQMSALGLFENQIKSVLLFEVLNELNY